MIFRTLPPFGADQRGVAEVVRGIMDGKTNNTGTITLATGNATSTTIYDERIGYDSKIILVPFSSAAFDDNAPYGAFQDDTDQTAAAVDVAYALALNTTDYTNGIYVSNTSRVNVRNYGIYNIQFSIQVKNTTNDSQNIDIWFRKNGTDVAGSDSRFGMPARKNTGGPSHLISAMNFFLEMNANDYFQIMWRVSDTGVSIEHYASTAASAGVTPAIPAVPSAIVTVSYVAPAATSNVYVSSQQQGSATLEHWSNATADKTYAYVIVG
jgi:hypothetical protein